MIALLYHLQITVSRHKSYQEIKNGILNGSKKTSLLFQKYIELKTPSPCSFKIKHGGRSHRSSGNYHFERQFTADNDLNICMYHLCAAVDRTTIIDACTFDDIFLKIQNKLVLVTAYR